PERVDAQPFGSPPGRLAVRGLWGGDHQAAGEAGGCGTTTSVSSSSSFTSTAAPTSAPAAQNASQSSPCTRTCPTGLHAVTTHARFPIIASGPVFGRQR